MHSSICGFTRHSIVTSVVSCLCDMSDRSGEWDRRKAYLARSLFEDLPRLSTISERREPGESADITECRSYSALPDLIIEKEKNRHDEPEEFYQELEKRMLKLYRKLFHSEHDGRSNMSSSDGSLELIDDLIRPQYSDVDRSPSKSQEDDDDVSEQRIASHESFPRDLLISDEESSEGPRHEVITTRAQVHVAEARAYRGDINNNIAEQIVAGSIVDHWSIFSSTGVQKNMERDEQSSERLVSTQDFTSTANHSPILLKRTFVLDANIEKEIMRSKRLVARQATTQKSTSYECELNDSSPIEVMRQKLSEPSSDVSMPNVRPSLTFVMEPKEIVPILETEKEPSLFKKTQSFINEEMVSEAVSSVGAISGRSGGFLDIALTDQRHVSSPILGTASRKRLRSADSSSSSEEPPRKIRKHKDIGLQTILDESVSNCTQPCCEQLQTNYFYGTPLIFNLCRCKDHTCQ